MPLALFDLDETLIGGNSASLWCQHMVNLQWADGETFLSNERELMRRYAEGRLAMEDYMAFVLAPLVGRSREEVEYEVAPFVEDTIEPLIHSQAMQCIAAHRAAGERILVISAAAQFLVAAIAERMGIEESLAIDLEERHGCFSGRPSGILSYREGKVRRLEAWLAEQGEVIDGASFYSDSYNDLPLLQRVERPHVVNPDPRLRAHAEAAGWPILAWR